MTMQKAVSIATLKEELINQLHEHHYKRSTIQLYTEQIDQLHKYMFQKHILLYNPDVSNTFYKEIIEIKQITECTKRFYRTVIRRLNDCYNANGYVYSVPRKNLEVSNDFQPYVNDYFIYCKKINNRPLTIKSKERTAHFFCENLEHLGCHSFDKMTAPIVIKATLMIKNHGFYPELKDLLRYLLVVSSVTKDFSTLVPKSNRGFRIPTTFTTQEIAKVERTVNKHSISGKRDYAIILLASRLGIRAGDIASLKFHNLDFNNNHITFTQNKTGNYSNLLMIPDIKNALQDYINNERPDSPLEAVFLSSFAPYGEISYSVVSFAVKKNMIHSGVNISGKKHGPHSLRSSLATSMVNDGIDYSAVRKVLGHEGPNAISNYAKLDIDRLRLCALPSPPTSGAFKCLLEGGDE
jgi:site-specific recombinase XerD